MKIFNFFHLFEKEMNSNKLFYLRVTTLCLARKMPLLLEHSQVGGISPFDVATLREVDS